MDQFSFHGPFAYRWIDDVPVERIDLRSGERRPIEVGSGGLPPVRAEEDPAPALTISDSGIEEEGACESVVRAAMAAWN
ncbi:MAG: hypothetical protein VKO39_08155 [Cyanobacteriota bacterium]|nr:hypothetical protein [Cyanobacteriota bacterium]